jgi:hypothetical protein
MLWAVVSHMHSGGEKKRIRVCEVEMGGFDACITLYGDL